MVPGIGPVAPPKKRIRLAKLGVQFDGFLEPVPRLGIVVLRSTSHVFDPTEEIVVGLEIVGRTKGCPVGSFHLVQLQKQAERRHHLADDLVLHRKDVLERPVITCRPGFSLGCRIDQLDSNSNLVRGLAHAALQHIFDAQLLPDLLLLGRLALVSEARVARDHKETGKPRQVIDQLVADTVAEIVLLRVATQVRER